MCMFLAFACVCVCVCVYICECDYNLLIGCLDFDNLVSYSNACFENTSKYTEISGLHRLNSIGIKELDRCFKYLIY